VVTHSSPPEKSENIGAFAVFLYLEFGTRFNSIAKYVSASMVTAMRWVRDRTKALKKPDIVIM
jgi:hypothetical protein